MCWERKIDYVGESRNDEWLDKFYDVGVYLVQAKGVGFFSPEMIFPTSSGCTGTKEKELVLPTIRDLRTARGSDVGVGRCSLMEEILSRKNWFWTSATSWDLFTKDPL